MPHTNKWESEGLYRKFTGKTSGDEILESNYELHADPRFKTIKYVINDFTKTTVYPVSLDHTRTYALTDDMISVTKGDLKIALVVTEPEDIALAFHYREQMKNVHFECEIFQTVEGARKWASNE